jgi:hypothetical protein
MPNGFPFYRVDDLTNALTPLAMVAIRVANIAQRYRIELDDLLTKGSNDGSGVSEYVEEENERFQSWIAQDWLARDFIRWIATDNFKAEETFLADRKEYARCFGPVRWKKQFSAVKQARIHALAAVILLAETLDRDQVTKGQVRRLACKLWTAGYKLRGCKSELPKVQWRRVYRALGLDDLRSSSNSRDHSGDFVPISCSYLR